MRTDFMAYMSDRTSPFNVSPRLVVGLGLVIFGGLLLLGRLDIVDVDTVLRLWPVILIAVGLQQFFNPRTGPTGERVLPVSGIIWMAIGGILLLNSIGVLRASLWEMFWPAILIAVGVRLMTRGGSRARIRHHTSFDDGGSASGGSAAGTGGTGAGTGAFSNVHAGGATPPGGGFGTTAADADSADTGAIFAVLSGVKRVAAAVPFYGTEVTACMGGAYLDLRRAIVPPGGEAVLDLFVVIGGCDLILPPHWIVSAPLVAVMGGIDDKRIVPPPSIIDDGSAASPPRLVIRGFVMMGGVTIRG
jgi:hypothetical protein